MNKKFMIENQNMIRGIVIFCNCCKPRRLRKTNQEQNENYCKQWKIITERIEVRVIEKLRPDKDKLLTSEHLKILKA